MNMAAISQIMLSIDHVFGHFNTCSYNELCWHSKVSKLTKLKTVLVLKKIVSMAKLDAEKKAIFIKIAYILLQPIFFLYRFSR